ncbi:MAG: TraB/GumN family protein, partial [Geobacter sp.]
MKWARGGAMGKNLTRILIAFTVTVFLFTSQSQAAPTPHGGKSFLWKIQTKAGTVHLFGSMHLARSDSYPLPFRVEESFAQADIVALEADPGMAMAEEMQQRLVRSALYEGNDTLRQHVSNDTYALASREIKRLGLAIEQFARCKPWFVAMTIDVLQLQQLGYSPEHGLDLYFTGKARGKKRIVELESFDYQISL